MPITQRVDKDARRVLFEISGEFSTGEIIQVVSQALTHPDFEPGFNVLSDHTGVTRVIERDQLQATAHLLEKFSTALTGAKWAVIVGNSELQWGMLRMLAGFSSGVPVEIQLFRDEVAAIEWLDATS